MSEDGKIEQIKVEDCTFEQLKRIVLEMQQVLIELYEKQQQVMEVINHNSKEFQKMMDDVNEGFKTRDEILKQLANTQKIIIRETDPIVGEYRKTQMQMMHQMFSAMDRGPKMDN
jgi:uncharacterized protein (DUF885 family)